MFEYLAKLPNRGIWPFGFSLQVLIFAFLLLFVSEMSEPVRRWFIPSAAVYLLASALLVFGKELAHLRYLANNRGNLPSGAVWTIYAVQVLMLVGLVWYNVCRGVL